MRAAPQAAVARVATAEAAATAAARRRRRSACAVSSHRGAGATQRAALLEDCLRLIMQLAVHLPRPAGEVHVVAEMQSELTHMLLLRARTHSEMVEAMSSADEDPPRAELLQAAIDAVAVLQPGSPSTYSLRNGAMRDYVPTHPHLSRTDHQHVLQRQETLIRQERP